MSEVKRGLSSLEDKRDFCDHQSSPPSKGQDSSVQVECCNGEKALPQKRSVFGFMDNVVRDQNV